MFTTAHIRDADWLDACYDFNEVDHSSTANKYDDHLLQYLLNLSKRSSTRILSHVESMEIIGLTSFLRFVLHYLDNILSHSSIPPIESVSLY